MEFIPDAIPEFEKAFIVVLLELKKNLKFEGLKKNLQINISPCQEVYFLRML